MSTTTPNYGFTLPGVNDPADANIWGNETNTNWSTLDTALKAVSDNANTALTYAPLYGEVKAYAGSSTPSKWLLCDGSAISRTTYASLFAAIGTNWGAGDGSTTFNVPDFKGRALFGRDDMGGSAANRITNAVSGITGTTLGATGGSQSMQTHTHSVTDPTHTHSSQIPNGSYAVNVASGVTNSTGTATNTNIITVTSNGINAASTGISINNTGSGSSQNMPPAAIVNWLIYAGV